MNTQELIPISHLSLDFAEPIGGWEEALSERGIELLEDDIGRASVPREVLGELIREAREREALLAEQAAQKAAARKVTVPAGVPALEGATPFESMASTGDFVSVAQEFGRPAPNFLEEELAEGRRQQATVRAEREAVENARRALEGRDK